MVFIVAVIVIVEKKEISEKHAIVMTELPKQCDKQEFRYKNEGENYK